MSVFDPRQTDGDPENEGGPRELAEYRAALPMADVPSGPYTGSQEHLWDELRRVDQLIRAQTVRWRLTIAADKPEHLWGMVHVTDAEVETYLESPFFPPYALPQDLVSAMQSYWRAADGLDRAIRNRRRRTAPDVVLRLDRLRALFGLSRLERDVLLVCLWPELDVRYRRLFGYLQDDASRTRPSVELVLQVLHAVAPGPEPRRAAFEPGSPLVRNRLLVIGGGCQGDEPLPARWVRVDDRISGYMMGSDLADERVVDALRPVQPPCDWDELIMEEREVERLQALADRLRAPAGTSPVLFLHGPYGSGRLKAARAMTTVAGQPLLVADVDRALRCACGWEEAVDLVFREAALNEAALYWAGCELLLERDQPPYLWNTLLAAAERFPGTAILAGQAAWEPAGSFRERRFISFEFSVPDFEVRCRLWDTYLPPAEALAPDVPERSALATLLANGFQLTEGQVLDALGTARAQAARYNREDRRLTLDDLYAGCRRQSGRRLVSLARRVEPRAGLSFDQLILPRPSRRQLGELRGRIRHMSAVYGGLGFERRLSLGKGLVALFTGSSGTGKTMAAELLAQEHGVDLYKVDLSAVVSKYVGETEKNLSRVFAEARDSNAILFFDEADALFGKRGEVKEAHDRYANIEINYLLQGMEEYPGVVVMATNLRQNIDEAFMRRIHVIVEFPFPDAEARFKIWKGMFPDGIARPADDEIRALATRFELAGGSIKNVVLDAAFRAVDEQPGEAPAIAVRHLVLGIGREYQKLGRPITRAEFGDECYRYVYARLLRTQSGKRPR